MFDNLRKLQFDKTSMSHLGSVQNTFNDVKQYVFDQAASEWNISHNYNTKNMIVQSYNDNNELIIASDVSIDNNNVILYFNENISGYANIMFIGGEI